MFKAVHWTVGDNTYYMQLHVKRNNIKMKAFL